jgi:hypothetical protein
VAALRFCPIDSDNGLGKEEQRFFAVVVIDLPLPTTRQLAQPKQLVSLPSLSFLVFLLFLPIIAIARGLRAKASTRTT